MRVKALCLVTVLALLGGACSDSGGLDPASDSRSDASSGVFFAEHDVTFVFPDGWHESYDEDLQEPAWRLYVSPTPFSGNWMSFLYLPGASRHAFNATEELFDSYVAELEERSQRIVRGPAEIELAGLAGRELSVEGIVGARTGKALMAEAVLLYGEDVTYILLAQYEPESRDEILSAWKTMIANLELPARAGEDAGVLLMADFDDGPEPFEDASGSTFQARAVDGRYRIEISSPEPAGFSYGRLVAPSRSIAIDLAIAGMDGSGERLVGIGCALDNGSGYYFGVSSEGKAALVNFPSAVSDGGVPIREGEADVIVDGSEIGTLNLQCLHDPDNQTTTLIGAVNDTVVVESMEHEDSATEFANMAIWFGGGEGSWRLEVEEVIVIAANSED